MFLGKGNSTVEIFDKFESTKEDFMLLAFPVTVGYTKHKYDNKYNERYWGNYNIYFIVAKGILNKEVIPSNITMSEIKNLSKKASGFVPLYKITDRMDMGLQYLPNISVQLYKFFTLLDAQIEKDKIEFKLPISVSRQYIYESGVSWDEQWKKIELLEEEVCKGTLIVLDNPVLLNAQNSSHKTDFGDEYHHGVLVKEGTKYGDTNGYPIVACLISQYGISKDNFKDYDAQLRKLLM